MITITDNDVFKELGKFLETLIDSIEVYRGQINRVPMPSGSFAIMNNSVKKRMATQAVSYDRDAGKQHTSISTLYTIQVDFYGKNSGDMVHMLQTIWGTDYAYRLFPDNIKPVTMSNPVQIALITGEWQYKERWKTDVELHYSPTVITDMQFFEDVDIDIIKI